MSASASIRAFRTKTTNKTEKLFRQVCLEMSKRIIERSPVDSGRFRGNWNASINSANLATSSANAPAGGAPFSRARSVVTDMPFGSTFYFTNNLPYAYRLEYEGYSKQAPAGMVRVTVAEFQQVVTAQVQAVRNGI